MKHIKKFAEVKSNGKRTGAVNESLGDICFLVAVVLQSAVESSYSRVFYDFASAQKYYLQQIRKRFGMEFVDYRTAKRTLRMSPPESKFTVDLMEIDVVR